MAQHPEIIYSFSKTSNTLTSELPQNSECYHYYYSQHEYENDHIPKFMYSCCGIINADTGEYLLPSVISSSSPRIVNVDLYHNDSYVTTTIILSPYKLSQHPFDPTRIVQLGTFQYDKTEYIYYVSNL